ncbi:MAG: UDP-N-acetylmuramate dehydrogenase [Pseudomonadota bacterium]|nr:UDP-N-acetylmuramate dehydrogenase [Pseudomonadota bacterium]
MLEVEANFQLGSLNTLKLECIAERYALVSTSVELQEALSEARLRSANINVLGGGSNLILNRYLPGMTIHMGLKGRELLEESADDVVVRLQAGEEWHETVLWANAEGYFGLENLALIPGSVGAAPVQNIGAYGVEIAQMIEFVHVVDSRNGHLRGLTAAQCCFSYRDSLFKTPEGKHLIITAVDLRLSKRPVVNTSYPALREVVPVDAATPSDVLAAVVAIRQSKLPDPGVEANVGSFFKNPIVDCVTAEHMKAEYPDMPQYPVDANTVKLSAAWMIDQLGWRGVEECGVSVSEKHALVVINKSARYASEVIEFTNKITYSVSKKYSVSLDREPELVGSDQRA